MDIIVFSDGETVLHRLDPRVRLLAAAALTLVLSQSHDARVLVAGMLLGVVGLVVSRVPLVAVLQRLVPLNAFFILLAGVLMFTTPGESVFRIGTVAATREGLLHGGTILLRGNAIVSLLACLVGTIEFIALGRALGQLRVPAKLVHVLLFTVRYINLMLAEYERLSQAAVLRGFRPGANLHTLRTTGYQVAMVLVLSYERGARMLQAMKLRGYDGTLPRTEVRAFRKQDYLFLMGVCATVVTLLGVEFA
ncbi:MAG: cobalt ECF transporter T component CbiQ [Candidatus Hydrogenedentes bacterium]|nr:cobalt ECF transporter T component CbiQ [Candidatus Hydrogenedentota bacterium]